MEIVAATGTTEEDQVRDVCVCMWERDSCVANSEVGKDDICILNEFFEYFFQDNQQVIKLLTGYFFDNNYLIVE